MRKMIGTLEHLFINSVEKQLRQQNKRSFQHQMQVLSDIGYYPATTNKSVNNCSSKKPGTITHICSKVVCGV